MLLLMLLLASFFQRKLFFTNACIGSGFLVGTSLVIEKPQKKAFSCKQATLWHGMACHENHQKMSCCSLKVNFDSLSICQCFVKFLIWAHFHVEVSQKSHFSNDSMVSDCCHCFSLGKKNVTSSGMINVSMIGFYKDEKRINDPLFDGMQVHQSHVINLTGCHLWHSTTAATLGQFCNNNEEPQKRIQGGVFFQKLHNWRRNTALVLLFTIEGQ